MKLGILPLGSHAARKIIPAVSGTGFEVSAILSRNPERVKEQARKLGASVYQDPEEFYNSGIEAVYISSPNYRHYPDAVFALEHGKHVLLEKQMTLNPEEADNLVDLAKEKGLVLNIGYHLRFHPAIEEVSTMIKDGKIGKILQLSGNWCGYSASYSSSDPVRDWWHDPEKVGGGSVMGTGVHVLDTLVNISGGMPEGVSAWKYPADATIEESYRITLHYPEFTATALSSRKVQVPDNALDVLGTNGIIKVTGFFGTGVNSDLYLNGELKHSYTEGDMYHSELNAFMDSIEGKHSRIATGLDGANIVRIVNAAGQSVSRNEVVNPSQV